MLRGEAVERQQGLAILYQAFDRLRILRFGWQVINNAREFISG